MSKTNKNFPGIEALSQSTLDQRYDDMLDDVYGEVKIGGYSYNTALALKNVDEIAYNQGYNNWLDSELGETLVEINGEYYDKQELDDAGIDAEDTEND